MGNLNEFVNAITTRDTINGTTKNGTLVLRCPFSLFLKTAPILNDENTKNNLVIYNVPSFLALYVYNVTSC